VGIYSYRVRVEDITMLSLEKNIVVRRAVKTDLPVIQYIHDQSMRELGKEDSRWFEALLKSRSKRIVFLVALVDGRVAGYCLAYRKKNKAYIENIAVDGSMRGLGVGGVLLSETERMLRETGVDTVYLSVKDWNTGAINFYLKNGYHIKNVVLWFTAPPEKIVSMDSSEYSVADLNASKIGSKLRYYASTWSSFVDDVDRSIYKKKLYRAERALVVKQGRKRVAFALYSVNDGLVVDTISLSSFNALEALQVLLNSLKNIALARGVKSIEIPVDSTKQSLVELLVESGFKMHESEFLLYKELVDS